MAKKPPRMRPASPGSSVGLSVGAPDPGMGIGVVGGLSEGHMLREWENK